MASSSQVTRSHVNGDCAPAQVHGADEESEKKDASQMRDWIADLTAISDKSFAAVSFGNNAEFSQLYQTANQAALDVWAELETSGAPEMQNNVGMSPVLEIEQLGTAVKSEPQGVMDTDFIHFAVFDPSRNVVEISEPSVAAVTELIGKLQLGDLLGDISVRDVVLWHEYYHVRMRYEERRIASLWNRDRVPVKRWRPQKLTIALRSWLSDFVGQYGTKAVRRQQGEELTAVLFSKVASGIPYSPQVFQWLLVYTREPDRAVVMIKDIIEKSVRI